MFKKTIFITFICMISLTACGTKETVIEKNSVESDAQTTESSSAPITSKENLFSVEITIPKNYLGSSVITQSDADEIASKDGFDKATLNEDGSVTYKMSKKKHSEMLDELRASTRESCDNLINGEDAIASFEKIVFNDELTNFSIYIDSSNFTKLDTINSFTFFILGGYYQLFNSVPNNDIDVQVDYIDNKTGETLNTGKLSELNDEDDPDDVMTEKEAINDIDSWIIDIWNYFVNFQAYRLNGTDCTGSDINIDFEYSQFENEYPKLAEYDNYISNLPDEYSDLKDIWTKMKEQIEIIYNDVSTNGVTMGGTKINLDLLSQYSNAFHDYISNLN